MKRCGGCGKAIVWSSLKDGETRFCSTYCLTLSPMPGFCQRCAAETSSVSPGSTTLLNGCGSQLMGAGARCPTCHSIVQRRVFCALYIPFAWWGRYRVIYTSRTSYVGRLLVPAKDAPFHPS